MIGQRIARFLGLAVAGMLPVLLIAGGAGAIVGGTVDNDGHPNVGLVVILDQRGTLADACTGTLIAPTVVLTAEHCLPDLPPGYKFVVTFDPTVDFTQHDNGFIQVTGVETNVKYDVGVLRLARPVDIEPARLPGENALEQYKKPVSFTDVGYGVDRAGETDFAHLTRRTLTSRLVELTDTLLFTRSSHGGICKGDSGGPVFSNSGVLVALGNRQSRDNCRGYNSGPRLDIKDVRSFLKPFVG
jgi:hypothetical protein